LNSEQSNVIVGASRQFFTLRVLQTSNEITNIQKKEAMKKKYIITARTKHPKSLVPFSSWDLKELMPV